MEKRIEALEITVSEMKSELKEIREVIGDGFKKIDKNFHLIAAEFKLVHKRIDQLNVKVDYLKGVTNEGFEVVGVKIDNLSGEITKIGKVTNYADYYKNRNSIN